MGKQAPAQILMLVVILVVSALVGQHAARSIEGGQPFDPGQSIEIDDNSQFISVDPAEAQLRDWITEQSWELVYLVSPDTGRPGSGMFRGNNVALKLYFRPISSKQKQRIDRLVTGQRYRFFRAQISPGDLKERLFSPSKETFDSLIPVLVPDS